MRRHRALRAGPVTFLLLALLLLAACAQAPASVTDNAAVATSEPITGGDAGRPEGWDEASHGEDAEPNYAVVFPDDKVNQITITIAPENWTAMQENLTELLGEPGTGDGFGGPGGQRPPGGEGGQPPAGGPGGFGGPGGGGDFTPENPMWVPATISFAGATWTNVGVRYKGNSSLQGSWRDGSQKLPFKLDFDQFEDERPEIANQRFYGFKQLSLSNNFGDATGMRETVAYDLLAEAGLPASNTGFYDLTLDYGAGPVSLGLYTAIEVVDDTVIARTFGDDSGNIYEGDGRAASLADGTLHAISASFQKENNEESSDWSDIEALYAVLHDPARTGDPAAWRAKLEATFDVPSFLEWLALSAIMQHWDTYGQMTHNFYLYHDPATDRLTWISWDHNFVLGGMGGRRGGGEGGGMGGRGNGALDKSDVGESWPLIRYLLDDPIYSDSYIGYLNELNGEVFDADELAARYEQLAALIGSTVSEESDQASFDSAVQALTDRTRERANAVADFLATAQQ
jgi:spore coat protein H